MRSGTVIAATPETGIVKTNRDFITVVAQGEGTNQNTVLQNAWDYSVRIALGIVVSSQSGIDSIVIYSRGIIEH